MTSFMFQNSGFLFALAALAIPVALHLIDRRMSKRIVFPSIRFIHKAQKLHSGKRQIRDWLVLLIRLGILGLIVILFASPILGLKSLFSDTPAEEVVLFYDLSVSMDRENFESFIRTESAKVIEAHPRARFGFIGSSDRVIKQLALTDARQQIHDQIKSLSPTLAAGDHFDALLSLENLFTPGETTKKFVYIFSDTQAYDWSASRLPALNIDAEFLIVRPGDSRSNMAIMKVIPEIFVKDDTRRLRATIQVHNFSLSSNSARLRLTAGKDSATRDIKLRSDHSEKFVIDIDNLTSDIVVAEIEAPGDYVRDNRYFFWTGRRAPIRVAIIADTGSDPGKSVEAFFLKNALSVSTPGEIGYDVHVVPPEFMWDNSLTSFHCIFDLDTAHAYTDIELEIINDYLENGGTMVHFAGRKTADGILRLNQADIISSRFSGFTGEVNRFHSYTISSIAENSAILSAFREEKSDLFQFPVYKFAKLEPSKGAVVLLRIHDGDPFLIHEKRLSGSVFILATSLASDWSEFPTSLSFVPLVRQIVAYAHSGVRPGIIELAAGENSKEKWTAAGLSENAEVPTQPGVYLIENIPVELNTTRVESDLRPLNEYEVTNRLSGTGSADRGTTTSGIAPQQNRSLQKPIAWALLIFFVSELLISNRTRQGKIV